jgi:hypothetical protein
MRGSGHRWWLVALLAAPLIGLLWLPFGIQLAAHLVPDGSGPTGAQVTALGWPLIAPFCVAIFSFFWLMALSLRTRLRPGAAFWQKALAWSGLVLALPPRSEAQRARQRRAIGLTLTIVVCVGFSALYTVAAIKLMSDVHISPEPAT